MWVYILALVLLAATPSQAATIYADNHANMVGNCTSGNYSISNHNCTGSDGNAYNTALGAQQAFAALSGGSNVLRYRAGSGAYTLSGTYGNANNSWPHSTSWETANIIENYPGEAVTITAGGFNMDSTGEGGNLAYLIIQGDSRSNFILQGAGGSGSGIRVTQATNHIRITKITIQNFGEMGIQSQGYANCGANSPDSIEIIDNLITNNGDNTNQEHGIYPACATNWLIEGNSLIANQGYGVHAYTAVPGTVQNITVRGNYVEGRRAAATGTAFGIIVTSGSGHKVHDNIIKLKSGSNPALTGCAQINGTNTSPLFYNNTCYGDSGSGIGIEVGTNVTNLQIKNNIFDDVSTAVNNLGSASTVVDYNLCPVATPDCNMTGSTNTVETATPGFITPGTNFALASGSAAINAGTTVSTKSCNGACDLGAFETLTFTGGSVTGNTLTLSAGMAGRTPLIIGAQSGYTVNNSRNVTGIALSGSSSVSITFDGAACAGESWTATYNESPGTATDSALIGGTMNQPIWDVGPVSVTNNCAGASYTFTQTKGEKYAAIGPQSTNAVILYASPGSYAAIRTKKKCTGAACPARTFKLRAATDGETGTYADVPDTFGAANVKFVGLSTLSGMDEHTTSVTVERLTSEFSGMTTGAVVRCASGCAVPSVTLAQDSECEMVWIIQFDTDAADGTVYHFREYEEDGTALTYAANSTPSITIRRHTAGF